MIKSLRNVMRQDKEKFKIPSSVQDTIPVHTIWKNGIFLVGNNKYSKTYQFTDINYGKASEVDKKAVPCLQRITQLLRQQCHDKDHYYDTKTQSL